MKITILTYGSRGDVQPFLALAVGLQKAGHQVWLAAPHRFADFIEARDISFVPLAGDPEIISERLNRAGANPIRMVRSISDYVFSVGDQIIRQAFAACENADLIIHSFLFTTGGHSLARELDLPDISVQTFPVFAPTRELPPVAMPSVSSDMLRYIYHWLITQVFWHGGNLGYRRLSKHFPDELKLDLHWPFSKDKNRIPTPLLIACSPTIIPRPKEWSSVNIHIPGYFFLDELETYQPPAELTGFLSAGIPPVCVTFGSTVHHDPEMVYRTLFDAFKETKDRGVILSGWSDLHKFTFSENIFVTDAVPHSWLLPRCKAIIHHGGAGTTAAGLRAGVPSIIVPSAADQPFWGMQVSALGAGPKPLPVRRLTKKKLVAALVEAEKKTIWNTSQAIGRKIRSEDGVGVAVEFIEGYAPKWGESLQSPMI